MYISKFTIANYKSFRESKTLEFTQGFNIISGQNNSGKTALLEALGLSITGNPHRSLKTVLAKDSIPDQVSRGDVWLNVSPDELWELALASGSNAFRLAKPFPGSDFANRIGFRDDSTTSAARLLEAIFSERVLTFQLHYRAQNGQRIEWSQQELPSYGLYEPQGGTPNYNYMSFRIQPGRKLVPLEGSNHDSNRADMGVVLAPVFQRHVYRFAAERMNLGKGPHGASPLLLQNATNLPEVLNQLQSNPTRFSDLNHQLSAIFPQIKHVAVRAIGPGQLEIVVWCHDPKSARDDLAVPLSESGTGIGQVLAVLYVVMNSIRPQTIVIDEPQSFLHPGAVRKLIEFLKMYSQHQYIIATHSATIISAASPRTITLARFDEGETTLQQLDVEAEKGVEATMAELGVRLSDSFGADNILWVEGRTEEKCFRLVVEKLLKLPLMGTEILGIRQTGDFEGRDARRVFEIYRTLTMGSSLLPPAIAFILDQECRDEATRHELIKLSKNLALFLPRRMYENYLLNPQAILEVANSIEGFRDPPISAEEVQAIIGACMGDTRYYCPMEEMPHPEDQITRVNAGRILEEVFARLSDKRVFYDKVKHGAALTEWIIRHSPEHLEELADLLRQALGVPNAEPAVGGAPAVQHAAQS
jgi:predicted ATPase